MSRVAQCIYMEPQDKEKILWLVKATGSTSISNTILRAVLEKADALKQQKAAHAIHVSQIHA